MTKPVYCDQVPSKSFKILDKINITFNKKDGKNYVQIYPFKIKINENDYSFNGLNGGIWNPNSDDILLGEIDENNNFCVKVVSSDLYKIGLDTNNKILGIIMYFNEKNTYILNHKEI